MTQQYYSLITNKGIAYINSQVLAGKTELICDGWTMAVGTGNLEPTGDTDKLINPILNKNSADYTGITFGYDATYGHYTEMILPDSVLGQIITEAGLFDKNGVMIAAAKTHLNLTEGKIINGLEYKIKQRIYLKAVPAYMQICYIPLVDSIRDVEIAKDLAESAAKKAEYYSSLVQFGMQWLNFSAEDFTVDGNNYKLHISDSTLILNTVYKIKGTKKILLQNVDIEVDESNGITIFAQKPFDGCVAVIKQNCGNYTFEQTEPSDVWYITHNLGKYPSVTAVDANNTVVVGTVQYNTTNSLTITFNEKQQGKAYLN